MVFEDFYLLVKEMRETQKKYFKTRNANVLMRSKELEKRLDKALDEIEEERKGMMLF